MSDFSSQTLTSVTFVYKPLHESQPCNTVSQTDQQHLLPFYEMILAVKW